MANAAEWQRRVEAWRKSGRTAGEFAEGRGFAEGTLRYWAWRLEKKTPAPKPQAPLRVVQIARLPSSSSGGLMIEVNGARVSVPAGVDRATLGAVLAALADVVRTP